MSELIDATRAIAGKLGIDPSDLLTAMSYETGGSLDPWAKGPTTQWGEHRGLIQWGEPQRQQYGVSKNMSISDQMEAVGRYLQDRGVKPGMGLLDVYSTINAGRPGLYNRSDAANGGAPGTVTDKVATQMYGHRMRANKLLGDSSTTAAPAVAASRGAAPAVAAPAAIAGGGAPAPDAMAPQMMAALQQIPKMLEEQSRIAPPPPMDVLNADPIGLARARALARAMAARPIA
jgi:hypothetical protein